MQVTENVNLRINRVVLRPDKLTPSSLIGKDTSPSSSAVAGAVSFALSSSSPYSPLAIRQNLLSSSVVKMMSDPSEEKLSTRVRMHLGEFPLQTSSEVYVSESLVWFTHFRDTLCCTKFFYLYILQKNYWPER